MATNRDTIAALINGSVFKNYSYSFSFTTFSGSGSMSLDASDSAGGRGIGIYINNYTGVRTYTIAGAGVDTAVFEYFGVPHHVSSGSLQVVAVSDSFIQGRFTLTADTFSITNGVFNYKQ